jgi:hypothetical protein
MHERQRDEGGASDRDAEVGPTAPAIATGIRVRWRRLVMRRGTPGRSGGDGDRRLLGRFEVVVAIAAAVIMFHGNNVSEQRIGAEEELRIRERNLDLHQDALERRRERSLDYVRRFRSDEMQESHAAIDREQARFADALQEALTLLPISGLDRYERVVLAMVEATGDVHVIRIVDFLDDAARCVVNDYCDRETLQQSLGDYVQRFLPTYMPFLCQRRREVDQTAGAQSSALFVSGAEDPCAEYWKDDPREGVRTASAP